MAGKVEEYLLRRMREDSALHMTLIDPEDVSSGSAVFLARESEAYRSSAIMVGGTTLASPSQLDKIVGAIKKTVKIPVILFPNNITGISRHADAIWFMSLINSADPYFITGAQVLAAPLVKKLGLEPIPLGYIIIGGGGAAGVVGKACPIPFSNPELAAAHALAAQYLGMRFVYLEAGSGVGQPIPVEAVTMVKRNIDIPLIVGGGIRSGAQAKEIVSAGADIIVTSTALQESERGLAKNKIKEVMEGIKDGLSNRIKS